MRTGWKTSEAAGEPGTKAAEEIRLVAGRDRWPAAVENSLGYFGFCFTADILFDQCFSGFLEMENQDIFLRGWNILQMDIFKRTHMTQTKSVTLIGAGQDKCDELVNDF